MRRRDKCISDIPISPNEQFVLRKAQGEKFAKKLPDMDDNQCFWFRHGFYPDGNYLQIAGCSSDNYVWIMMRVKENRASVLASNHKRVNIDEFVNAIRSDGFVYQNRIKGTMYRTNINVKTNLKPIAQHHNCQALVPDGADTPKQAIPTIVNNAKNKYKRIAKGYGFKRIKTYTALKEETKKSNQRVPIADYLHIKKQFQANKAASLI